MATQDEIEENKLIERKRDADMAEGARLVREEANHERHDREEDEKREAQRNEAQRIDEANRLRNRKQSPYQRHIEERQPANVSTWTNIWKGHSQKPETRGEGTWGSNTNIAGNQQAPAPRHIASPAPRALPSASTEWHVEDSDFEKYFNTNSNGAMSAKKEVVEYDNTTYHQLRDIKKQYANDVDKDYFAIAERGTKEKKQDDDKRVSYYNNSTTGRLLLDSFSGKKTPWRKEPKKKKKLNPDTLWSNVLIPRAKRALANPIRNPVGDLLAGREARRKQVAPYSVNKRGEGMRRYTRGFFYAGGLQPITKTDKNPLGYFPNRRRQLVQRNPFASTELAALFPKRRHYVRRKGVAPQRQPSMLDAVLGVQKKRRRRRTWGL